jgi:hypothetical protein
MKKNPDLASCWRGRILT